MELMDDGLTGPLDALGSVSLNVADVEKSWLLLEVLLSAVSDTLDKELMLCVADSAELRGI